MLIIVEDKYFEAKITTAPGAPSGLRPLVYKLMYLLTKPVLKKKIVKILRIFYIEIDIL